MDTDKVISFLKEVADQLGPLGEQAFRLIVNRIIAESIASLILGVGLFIGFYIVGWKFVSWGKTSKDSDADIAILIGYILYGFGLALLLICAIPSITNLLSPEYAGIERVLKLVGGRN